MLVASYLKYHSSPIDFACMVLPFESPSLPDMSLVLGTPTSTMLITIHGGCIVSCEALSAGVFFIDRY